MKEKKSYFTSENQRSLIFIKGVVASTSAALLGLGIYCARKPINEKDFPPENPKSPVRFARRALAISMIISLSGFALVTAGVSILLHVDSPKQLRRRFEVFFGDRFKLVKKKNEKNELLDVIESGRK